MRTFHCDHCHSPVYFENTACNSCGYTLGFLPEFMCNAALRDAGDGTWEPLLEAASQRGYRYKQCENYRTQHVCNWMVPADSDDAFCLSCRLNGLIPNLSRDGFHDRWLGLERAKRRLLYSLIKLGLPLHSKKEDVNAGLEFVFMSDLDAAPGQKVMTGHANGTITLNISEADSAQRERNRLDMDEAYRTLLGHFRHEVGHYYWDVLIAKGGRFDDYRALFGDERADYATALETHYANGPAPDWQARFISAYASSHPWEDWAESWAHYLHIVDTLETAANFDLSVEHNLPGDSPDRSAPDFDPYLIQSFDPIIENWLPLTFALNSLNRSMGLQDLYPFVLSPPAIDKLRFIHEVVRAQRDFVPGYRDVVGSPQLSSGIPGRMDQLRRWLGGSTTAG